MKVVEKTFTKMLTWRSSDTRVSHFARLENDLRHLRRSSAAWWVKEGGIEKKIAPTATKKERGEEAPMPRHCARSASDPRTRPFFPLSAAKAFRTTALVLDSQGFGCPTVVQGLSKRVQ